MTPPPLSERGGGQKVFNKEFTRERTHMLMHFECLLSLGIGKMQIISLRGGGVAMMFLCSVQLKGK